MLLKTDSNTFLSRKLVRILAKRQPEISIDEEKLKNVKITQAEEKVMQMKKVVARSKQDVEVLDEEIEKLD